MCTDGPGTACGRGLRWRGFLGYASAALLLSLAVVKSNDSPEERFQGTLTILSGDMTDEGNDLVYLLHIRDPAPQLYELAMPPTHMPGSLHSGDPVVVLGRRAGPDTLQVVSVTSVAPPVVTVPRELQEAQDEAARMLEAMTRITAPAASQPKPRGLLDGVGATAPALAAAAASKLNHTRMVRDMPTLFLVVGICTSPPAMSVKEMERVVFAGPGSDAHTLEGYYYECSRGRAAMNRANSLVLDNITLPCSFNGSYRFSSSSCAYRDSWGWHTYAQAAAVAANPGLDLSRFRHRVLVLPRGFTYWAGCPWMGLGTLGPVEKGADGSYISSMSWIQGESATSVMAFMHELGHNLYLHHANDSSGCEYCDWSSVMGGCCAVRCHNAPHNWQLGWGAPLAVLNAATLPLGATLTFDLPAQHAADASVLWIQPDWIPAGRRDGSVAFPVSYYLSYRVDSGKYDADIPDNYLYATNVYFWDGLTQTTVRRSRYVASVFTGEVFHSGGEDRFLVRQLSHGVGGGRVGVCRYNEEKETSCGDGIDNDCDGLVDRNDPDCYAPSPPPSPPPPPPRPPRPRPPPRYEPPGWEAQPPSLFEDGASSPPPPGVNIRPPHPPSPPPPPPSPPPPAPPLPPRPPPPPSKSPPPPPKALPPPPSPSPPPSPPPPSPPPPPGKSPPPPNPRPPSPPPPSPPPPSFPPWQPLQEAVRAPPPSPPPVPDDTSAGQIKKKKSPPPARAPPPPTAFPLWSPPPPASKKKSPPPATAASPSPSPPPPKPPKSPPPPRPPPPSSPPPPPKKARIKERRLAFRLERDEM